MRMPGSSYCPRRWRVGVSEAVDKTVEEGEDWDAPEDGDADLTDDPSNEACSCYGVHVLISAASCSVLRKSMRWM
ncbi:hypothetical protein HPP92_003810 [Vanilla planifolia]|uniref:Uncharacterized protein n=1 Tax=Vanilla planifolia TaxID=51239 RepID=A0A835VFU4_VANPL|nr:hypothetical protein HPP92_003810 [Vanilla planifolia]